MLMKEEDSGTVIPNGLGRPTCKSGWWEAGPLSVTAGEDRACGVSPGITLKDRRSSTGSCFHGIPVTLKIRPVLPL